MDTSLQRARIAHSINVAAQSLLEGSERLHDLQRFDLSREAFELSLQALHLAKEQLDVLPQSPSCGRQVPEPLF